MEKTALTKAAVSHIQSLQEKKEQLKHCYQNIEAADVTVSADGRTARFPFIQGETLAEILGRQIQNGQAPVQAVKETMERVFSVTDGNVIPFAKTEAFEEVFGSQPEDFSFEGDSYPVTNLDGIFENMMEDKDGNIWVIDYEWVFDFPVPAEFARYRNLAYFYYKYEKLMEYADLTAFLAEFGISSEMASVYGDMEKSFQAYVHGDSTQGYFKHFEQRIVTGED